MSKWREERKQDILFILYTSDDIEVAQAHTRLIKGAKAQEIIPN